MIINSFDNIPCKTQEAIPSFIRKTYDILEEAKHPDIIDWNSEGTALVIKKASEFCQKVLPAYFKHSNLTSFVRQLNMYNFHKKRTHTLEHIYYHELFQRGKRHLLKEIKRKTADSTFQKDVKTPELSESPLQGKDVSSLLYENQMLKRLYKDTMSKLHMLENEVKELNSKNQALWNQINKNGQNQIAANSFSNSQSQNSNFVSDQFSNTTDIVYPSYSEYGTEYQVPLQYEAPFDKKTTQSYFTNLSNNEFSGESTEASLNNIENDRGLEWTEPTPSTAPYNQDFPIDDAFMLPGQNSQIPQNYIMRPINEQFITGGVQQVNKYNAENDYFNYNNIQKPSNVLGKRSLERVTIDTQFEEFEPISKRLEVCNFNQSKLGVLNEGHEIGMDMVGNYNNPGFYSWGSN